MNLKTLKDMPALSGKKVIVRVDFNVPLDKSGNIRNDVRIKFAIPTLKYLLDHGAAQLILMTHVGRPKGAEPELRTNKMAEHLGELMGVKVAKVDDWGQSGLPDAKIVMLENLRFNPGEKSKDDAEVGAFGKQLAGLADCYVNEAFSNSHRKHASMTWVPKNIPGFAGLGVEKEVMTIASALENPKHPLIAVIAGAKADKLTAIDNMLKIADKVLIGGALAFALKMAQGHPVGASKIDTEGMSEMPDLVDKINKSGKILLPVDAVVADSFSETANYKTVDIAAIEKNWMALDIGPRSTEEYVKAIKGAKTVFWFGPLGVFEWEPYSHSTKAVGEAIANSGALSIVGGGDSATAVEKFGLTAKMGFVSTGGGASLQMLEGKPLPAIEILKK